MKTSKTKQNKTKKHERNHFLTYIKCLHMYQKGTCHKYTGIAETLTYESASSRDILLPPASSYRCSLLTGPCAPNTLACLLLLPFSNLTLCPGLLCSPFQGRAPHRSSFSSFPSQSKSHSSENLSPSLLSGAGGVGSPEDCEARQSSRPLSWP